MWCNIGYRKDDACLRLNGQKPSSPYAAISAMLNSEGRAFVLIQVLYCKISEICKDKSRNM